MFGNSRVSLLSNLTNRQVGRQSSRSRKISESAHRLGRSVSRVSNLSPSRISRAGQTPEDTHSDEESTTQNSAMFKFSSASSLDHVNEGNVTEWMKKNSRRKKHSIASSAMSPSKTQHEKLRKSSGTHSQHLVKSPSRNSSISKSDLKAKSNLALVRHLELMHSFTSEAVKLLKKEDDRSNSDEEKFEDSAKIIRALEENHEELRQLLLNRLKPKSKARSRHPSVTNVNNSGNPTTTDADPETTENEAKLNSNDEDPNAKDVAVENPDNELGLPLENEADAEYEFDNEKSHEETTVLYNDNTSVQEESNIPQIEEDAVPEVENLSSLPCSEPTNEPIYEEANITEATTYEYDHGLEPIAEQPELGYQSESDSINITVTKLKENAPTALDPVAEDTVEAEDESEETTKLLDKS